MNQENLKLGISAMSVNFKPNKKLIIKTNRNRNGAGATTTSVNRVEMKLNNAEKRILSQNGQNVTKRANAIMKVKKLLKARYTEFYNNNNGTALTKKFYTNLDKTPSTR